MSESLDHRRGRSIAHKILAVLLLASLTLKLNHLGHHSITPMDESFHALVARNVMADPFRPTLYADPALPFDVTDWKSNHVWLHKPIWPFWQMAGSMAVFGVETWSLRLPSALAATATAWLVYLIGTRLMNRWAGLIAATLASINPSIHTLVHGYIFSDHVDTALLFWTTAGVWLSLRAIDTGRRWDAAAAGAAQGVAFLCKTYPGLIVSVVFVACVLAERYRVRGFVTQREVPRGLLRSFAIGAFAIAGPWLLYCAARFPEQFFFEQVHALSHLVRDVEQWAAPWDRLWASYLLSLNFVFYPVLLVSLVIAARSAARGDRAAAVPLLWWVVVVVMFTLARSKTPTATVIALPAAWLLISFAARRAWSGDAFASIALAVVAILGVAWPGEFPRQSMGASADNAFAGILRENLWPFVHAAIALSAGAVTLAGLMPVKFQARAARFAIVAAAAAALWLGGRSAYSSYRITERPEREAAPSLRETGLAIRKMLPADAVVLIEETAKFQHIMLMFWCNRPVYTAIPANLARASELTSRPVFIVMRAPRSDDPLLAIPAENCWVYRLK